MTGERIWWILEKRIPVTWKNPGVELSEESSWIRKRKAEVLYETGTESTVKRENQKETRETK